MIFRPFGLLAAICTSLALASTPANAHPHVWVKVNSELVYAPDGTVTGVRHVWTFDDMFSTYAVQGIEAKQKGVFTREQLAPVAEENVSSMKEFEYFTFAKADGKKAKFRDPVDYWLEFEGRDPDVALLPAARSARKSREPQPRGFRSGVFHRLRVGGERSGQARGRAIRLQARRHPAAGSFGAAAKPAPE